jgi:hypothetical protein
MSSSSSVIPEERRDSEVTVWTGERFDVTLSSLESTDASRYCAPAPLNLKQGDVGVAGALADGADAFERAPRLAPSNRAEDGRRQAVLLQDGVVLWAVLDGFGLSC